MLYFISIFILWLLGWKVSKPQFQEKSYVIIAAPHTSNWDFVFGRLAMSALKVPQKVLMKKEMFFFPLNYILRGLGAIPIDRAGNMKMVDYIISVFKKNPDFIFSISPEGTRSYTKKWKTGFYQIAMQANVPLVFGRLDYKLKSLELSNVFYPTGNLATDFEEIKAYFSQTKGLNPEKFNPHPTL